MSEWRKFLIWMSFWFFVILSWAAIGVYAFIAGQGPSDTPSDAASDGMFTAILWLLMPLQVAIGVWLKSRSKAD